MSKLLTDEEKIINMKKAKQKYYQENKEKDKMWKLKGHLKYLLKINNVELLTEYKDEITKLLNEISDKKSLTAFTN